MSWVQVVAVLEDEGRVADGGVFEDCKGLGAIGPASTGEGGVFEGYADVVGDDGVEAQGLVHGVLQVAHGFQVLVGGFRGRVRA